jgi:hypothetical protein
VKQTLSSAFFFGKMAASSSVDIVNIDRAKIIGKGSFGIVFEGVWCGLKVAVKRIPIENATSSEREENALEQFDHENVVKLFHVEKNQDFRYLKNQTVFEFKNFRTFFFLS